VSTNRERFIDYVKNGGAAICSPQIGAGAGFDTRLAGKEWVSETTLEDTLAAVGRFDILPLLNVGCPYETGMAVQWETVKTEKQGDRITTEHRLTTPVGTLTRKLIENKREGTFQPKYPVSSDDDLGAMEYYIDALLDADYSDVTVQTRAAVQTVGGRGPLSVQWAAQPYELLCLPNTVDTVMLHNDYPERCEAMMKKIIEIDKRLFKAVANGGGDFIFLGGPAAEMVSPSIYERLIIPNSQIVTEAAHASGLLVYSHICSPIEPFLTMGFYNRMGIDLFETLSPPPVGNVKSIGDALSKLDDRICTRGNVGLDVLLNGTAEDVRAKILEILKASVGRKHIVAASDYLFYNTPEENVRVMAETVKAFA
jgi:hypothetical protein